MKKLKKGEWIRCADENDMRKLFKALNQEGYSAVRLSSNSRVVVITGTPGEKIAPVQEKGEKDVFK